MVPECNSLSFSGDGLAVNGVVLSGGQTLTIVYGGRSSGGPGLIAPSFAETDTFAIEEASTATSPFTPLTSSPSISVNVTGSETDFPSWAGYIVTSGDNSYSSISGSWLQPSLSSCPTTGGPNSFFWIGFDGTVQDGPIEQIGTAANCSIGGGASYYGWWQMNQTSGQNQLNTSSYPVAAGDSMSAVITVSGTNWTLKLRDWSQEWIFSMSYTLQAPEATAEWIAEAPIFKNALGGTSEATLADFNSVSFSNTETTWDGKSGPVSDFPYVQINMDNPPSDCADTSPLSLGVLFSVSYSSSCGESGTVSPRTIRSFEHRSTTSCSLEIHQPTASIGCDEYGAGLTDRDSQPSSSSSGPSFERRARPTGG